MKWERENYGKPWKIPKMDVLMGNHGKTMENPWTKWRLNIVKPWEKSHRKKKLGHPLYMLISNCQIPHEIRGDSIIIYGGVLK